MKDRARRALLLSLLLTGCSQDDSGDEVVDAVIVTQEEIRAAIEADPDAWTTTLVDGVDVAGLLEGANGGTVDVSGWRFEVEEDAATGFHSAFGEKLFLSFNTYAVLDLTLSGQVVITTHTLDFSRTGADAIEDANRTTGYVGVLTASGAASGSYQIEVNGLTASNTQWTCGTVNGQPFGHGECF